MNAKYYECHVTLEPVFDERLDLLKVIAKEYGFQVADLLMQRRAEDKPERSAKDSFCTSRSKEYEELLLRMNEFVEFLELWEFRVWRKKIEAVLLDERCTRE